MPITKARSTGCDQICSACGTERTLDYTSIRAGVHSAESGRTDPNSCQLPACATCGAVEYLIRTWDSHPDPQNHSAKHKALVNRIFKVLVRKGRAEEHCAAIYAAETEDPHDVHPEDPDDHPEVPIDIGPPGHLKKDTP